MDRRPARHTNGRISWRLTQDSGGHLTADSGGCSDGHDAGQCTACCEDEGAESACRVPKMLVCRPSAGGGCTASEAVVSGHFGLPNTALLYLLRASQKPIGKQLSPTGSRRQW